jgi:hypothetical protein
MLNKTLEMLKSKSQQMVNSLLMYQWTIYELNSPLTIVQFTKKEGRVRVRD